MWKFLEHRHFTDIYFISVLKTPSVSAVRVLPKYRPHHLILLPGVKRKVWEVILPAGNRGAKRWSNFLKLQWLLREKLAHLGSLSRVVFCISSQTFSWGRGGDVPPNGLQRGFHLLQAFCCSHWCLWSPYWEACSKTFLVHWSPAGHKTNKISVLYDWPRADRCIPLVVLELTVTNGNCVGPVEFPVGRKEGRKEDERGPYSGCGRCQECQRGEEMTVLDALEVPKLL